MRYLALATDYDGTLALHGQVDETTIESLERLLATGRRLILVTGRELDELQSVFPRLDLFELVVAENGALLYRPATKESKPLAEPPNPEFVDELRRRGVERISVGHSIVATWEPHENAVLETIRDLGLDLQVIFNKGAVMVLPSGVTKATGLAAALDAMSLSSHNVVGIGDAENDHALLKLCEFSVAVENALPAVKETADLTTEADHGAGVRELVERLVLDDLASYAERLVRHNLLLGQRDGDDVCLAAFGPTVLICGPSGSGKSTAVTRLVESLVDLKYQFCLIDPEGDYETFDEALVLGSPNLPPSPDKVLELLGKPGSSAIVNLTGMKIPDRPPFFLSLLGPLFQLRTHTGRPHWLVLDEAHHLMPADWGPPAGVLPEQLHNLLLITVHPDLLSPALLGRIDTLLIVGANTAGTLKSFCEAAGADVPSYAVPELEPGELLMWSCRGDSPPVKMRVHICRTERRRHRRKYVEGELPPDRSFYFRGRDQKLNLRAQNMKVFVQLAEGVDDATWEHHLRQGDYSTWFREAIKDDDLAAAVAEIEQLAGIKPTESRQRVRAALERDYMVDAPGPLPVPGAD
ncbi:MAG: HAD-IIB family hydrolase [Pirellulales bacterium]|nr:HAD-IIB family hydrolase [Pirellulales bacterium]